MKKQAKKNGFLKAVDLGLGATRGHGNRKYHFEAMEVGDAVQVNGRSYAASAYRSCYNQGIRDRELVTRSAGGKHYIVRTK